MNVNAYSAGSLSDQAALVLITDPNAYGSRGATGEDGTSAGISTSSFDATQSQAQKAIAAIVAIVMQGNGDTSVSVTSEEGSVSVTTGEGNDDIDVRAETARKIYSGDGNDLINIVTRGGYSYDGEGRMADAVARVQAGAGDDRVAIDSHGTVDFVSGGAGNDALTIASGIEEDADSNLFLGVTRVDGDDGDDIIAISSKAGVFAVSGGTGNDEIRIASQGIVAGVEGGSGDDDITIAGSAAGIRGGAGNDVIRVIGSPQFVDGGAGNDHIVFQGNDRTASSVIFGQGDDLVETDGALVIKGLMGGDAASPTNVSFARISADTLVIGVEGRDDTMTVHLTGAMAAADKLEFELDSGGGLLIRQAGSTIGSNLVKQFSVNASSGTISENPVTRRVLDMPDTIAVNR
ncbi:hypothetical protein [Aurantimonas sp. VKM B-3413]|uniref:hypothetical protein n=1 Tax=Aurantimonas sp. VKM B-3413 TaxID=2779401 RepID=UPI001E3DB980|nr:hypothetical protein [Aurantimonas sp. VKM B-3413]MCB8836897.1 hypothetical protein [Aurantimonas sp. VKM B-3413]